MSELPNDVPERRVWPRRTESGDRVLIAWVGKWLQQVPVHSISVTGVGLVLDHGLDPGEIVQLELLNNAQHFRYLKLLRVVQSTLQSDGRWLVGHMFLQPLTDEELRALLE